MMYMLAEYVLFFAKTLTIVIAIIVVVAIITAIASKGREKSKEKLKLKKLNDKYNEMAKLFRHEILSKKEFKQFLKHEKKSAHELQEQKNLRKRIYVLGFQGDIRASAVKTLREEITAILTVATPDDEVVLKLESPGGMVHAYGLAASQLARLRQYKIPLTIVIDKVAASGGYMMASVGNKILAAPFAVIGSIGVIAQLPNLHRLLKKNDIEFEQIMAGEYKRTLTVFGENTKEGRKKFQAEVDETQELFKEFVSRNRPQVDIEKVATGEHWYGTRAFELRLIDAIATSDDYLLNESKLKDIYEVCYATKKSLVEKLFVSAHKGIESIVNMFVRRHIL